MPLFLKQTKKIKDMKTKTKILISATIAAVISLVVLCTLWDCSVVAWWIKAICSVIFLLSVIAAGIIACTYEGGQDDDF